MGNTCALTPFNRASTLKSLSVPLVRMFSSHLSPGSVCLVVHCMLCKCSLLLMWRTQPRQITRIFCVHLTNEIYFKNYFHNFFVGLLCIQLDLEAIKLCDGCWIFRSAAFVDILAIITFPVWRQSKKIDKRNIVNHSNYFVGSLLLRKSFPIITMDIEMRNTWNLY